MCALLLPNELQKQAGSHVAMLKLKRQTLFLVTARRLVVFCSQVHAICSLWLKTELIHATLISISL